MKRIFMFVFVMVMVCSLCACGGVEEKQTEPFGGQQYTEQNGTTDNVYSKQDDINIRSGSEEDLILGEWYSVGGGAGTYEPDLVFRPDGTFSTSELEGNYQIDESSKDLFLFVEDGSEYTFKYSYRLSESERVTDYYWLVTPDMLTLNYSRTGGDSELFIREMSKGDLFEQLANTSWSYFSSTEEPRINNVCFYGDGTVFYSYEYNDGSGEEVSGTFRIDETSRTMTISLDGFLHPTQYEWGLTGARCWGLQNDNTLHFLGTKLHRDQ